MVWRGEQFQARLMQHLRQNLAMACLIVERQAKRNVAPGGPSGFKTSHGGAGLRGSITHLIDFPVGYVGTNLKYARIHELGGTIHPVRAGALSIPLTDYAKKAGGARNYPGQLRLIVTKLGQFLLHGMEPIKSKGKLVGVLERPQYVLRKTVMLRPRSYLFRAFTETADMVKAMLLRPMRF